jgi:1-acyl-sn-glycerol-3-phosphate acyltransferase
MSRKEIPIFDLVRSTLLWIILLSATLVYGILVIPFVILRMPSVVHWFARMWGKTLALLSGMRVHVRNKEKVFRNGPVIIVANHQSMFDIPVFYSFLDTEFRWMAKASLFKIPFVGWGMSGAGYIPVERGDRKKAMESLFQSSRAHPGRRVRDHFS